MENRKTYRIFALLLLLLIIIDAGVLFAFYYNTMILVNKMSSHILVYILIALIPVLGILLLLVGYDRKTIVVTENTVLSSSEDQQQEKKKSQEKKEEGDDKEEEKKALQEVAETIKKVVPKVTATTKLEKYTENFLSKIAQEFNLVEGLFYTKHSDKRFKISGLYAYFSDTKPKDFVEGEGLCGQVVKNKKLLNIKNVPDDYITVVSGLGEGTPKHLLLVPIFFNNNVTGLLELASFNEFDTHIETVFDELSNIIGENLNNIQKPEKK